ncbi:MAG: RidA family protein [Granulosicoccus sp.]
MTRRTISQGSPFEEKIGYSRAVVDGNWIFVAGTTGYDYANMFISEDVTEQTKQCLRNIEWALTQANSSLEDVVRVRYILPNASDWPACWEPLREAFGDIRPAATMFVAALSEVSMKIEIEVTALRKVDD